MLHEPALSENEWNTSDVVDAFARDAGVTKEWNPSARKALAAKLLRGQPFGFTWEDVDLLRQWAKADPYIVDVAWADTLAARIAALLPPRT